MTVYVDDNFDARAPLTDTLGAAPTGGDYTGDGTATDITSGGVATITHTAATNTVARLLSATAAQDVESIFTVATDKVPASTEVQIRMGLRIVDTSNYYRIGIYPQPTADVILDAHAFIAGVAQTSFISLTHPTLTWSANVNYKFKVQVEGTSPTTVRIKVWDASGAEPGSWDASATNSEASLQTSGTYGFIFRTTSSLTNFPIVASYDDWLVQDIPAGGPGGVQAGWTFGTPAGGL